MEINLKRKVKGSKHVHYYWKAFRATTENEYDDAMKELLNDNKKVYDWLISKNKGLWSKAFYRTHSLCDTQVNNTCECFNNELLEARRKPILQILEAIRGYIFNRWFAKKEEVNHWKNDIGHLVKQIFYHNKDVLRLCNAIHSGGGVFQVSFKKKTEDVTICVSLSNRTYTCRQ